MANSKREQVTVTLDSETRAAIKRVATAERRTVSNQIQYFVVKALEHKGDEVTA
jgi:hypothetical protein